MKRSAKTAVVGPTRQMHRRILVMMAIFGIGAFVLLLARLFDLQILQHDELETQAVRQQLREAPTSIRRGTIYDANGEALAVSAPVENVYVSPNEILQYGEDRELIARGLAQILGLSYDEVYEKTGQTGSWYVTVARKLERDKADEVRRFKLENDLHGVRLEPDVKRYYPNHSLASHVIGFVGTDNTGLEGIEARYDSELSGTEGRTARLVNAMGTELLFQDYESYTAGEDGCDLVMTIDAGVQYFVEKQLRQAVLDYDIQNGAGAIVMDVDTGAILAMASLGDYDPNDFLRVSGEAQRQIDAAGTEEEAAALLRAAQTRQWRNKALSDTYEPGSTFKIITLAMALEEGAVRREDSFFCGGRVGVTGRSNPIRCWKDGGHGSQTLTQAVQHSCNVAFVNIGLRVGAEAFYRYCEAFGFLELSEDADANLTAATGIDLAGESGSIWWSRNTFCSPRNLSQLAAASFGQTFTITPLQLITAVSACVNGGRLMQPFIVRQIRDPSGEIVYEREPRLVRRVISEETSAAVREILEQVVGDPREGTGRNAAVAGYRIGGKTGTSEKVSLEAATGEKEYIVSFIGFAPADEPRIAVLVFLDTPSSASGIYISGGQMAAPVVGRMMADILPYLGVEPELGEEERQKMDARVPDLSGLDEADALAALGESGLRFRRIGEGTLVTGQLPLPGTAVAAGSEILLYFGAEPSRETETVPDLSGLTYLEAREALSAYGIYLSTPSLVTDAARQKISTQSLAPGTSVAHGTVIEVTLVSGDDMILGRY